MKTTLLLIAALLAAQVSCNAQGNGPNKNGKTTTEANAKATGGDDCATYKKKLTAAQQVVDSLKQELAYSKVTSIDNHGNTMAYRLVYNGKPYSVYVVNPKKQKVNLIVKPKTGKHGFAAAQEYYEKKKEKNEKLVFAMNGGMYLKNQQPQGLCVSRGQQLNPIDLKKNTGIGTNFYMFPPNGVFAVDEDNGAHVVVSDDYKKLSKSKKIRMATQSGPMLVHGGNINKAFNQGSTNVHIRNGVGVNQHGSVVFVISDVKVNFYDMAALYRDVLGCQNALYLDGLVSRMYLPAIGRNNLNDSQHLGPIITVTE